MTTDEKIRRFLQISIEDASSVGETIINEYKDAQEKLFEEHKENASKNSEFQIKTEKEKAKRDMNKELSQQQLHIKRKINRKQVALKDMLFVEVKELVLNYMNTVEYTQLLIEQINEAKAFAKNQSMVVYIDPTDASKKQMLEEATGVALTVSEYSFIGGTRVVIPEQNILMDKSFVKKMEEAKEKFVFHGGNLND